MPDIRDWHAHLAVAEKRKREEKQREHMAALPRMRDVSVKAQQVLDHPAWQWYADKLSERIAEIEARRAQTTHKMIFGAEMGHELELLKIVLNVMDAEVAGLRYAATLTSEAVAMGQQIAGEINTQAAAATADR